MRNRSPASVRRTPVRQALFLLLGSAMAAVGLAQGIASPVLVAEMELPPGVVVDDGATRQILAAEVAGSEGLARFRAEVEAGWAETRRIDWLALSRYQLPAMEGWQAPAKPGELPGRVLGRDTDGRLHLELRGPRLPARFDIVYRYVYLFAVYDPATGGLDDFIVTIRGWVEE